MKDKDYSGLLTVGNIEKVQEAWAAGQRSVTIGYPGGAVEVYSIERAKHPAYLLVKGHGVTAQVEVVKDSGLKSTGLDGSPLR